MWVQPYRSADLEVIPPKVEGEPKVAVLLNANARKVTDRVVRTLSHAVPEGDLFLSRSELDCRRIAQTVLDRRYHTVFLGGGEAGDVLAFGGALDFEADLVFVFGSGLAENDDGAQGFGVDAGHQKGVAAFDILPELANLNCARAHRRKRL